MFLETRNVLFVILFFSHFCLDNGDLFYFILLSHNPSIGHGNYKCQTSHTFFCWCLQNGFQGQMSWVAASRSAAEVWHLAVCRQIPVANFYHIHCPVYLHSHRLAVLGISDPDHPMFCPSTTASAPSHTQRWLASVKHSFFVIMAHKREKLSAAAIVTAYCRTRIHRDTRSRTRLRNSYCKPENENWVKGKKQ